MSDDIDYSTLPIDERLSHKLWKARLEAYDELADLFAKSRNEQDEVFRYDAEVYKKMILDANVVAQESGYKCFVAYLKYGATPQTINRLKSINCVTAICEKGLSSARKGTKELAIESLLLFVEISDKSVVEDILPSLTNKLPKLVTGCVVSLTEIVSNYGCVIVDPKPVIQALPKLFGHADKNVRAETTKLTVELYKWMGEALKKMVWEELKPIQQRELAKHLDAVEPGKPQQVRFTRKQEQQRQLEQQQQELQSNSIEESDVIMEDAETPEFDPYQMIDPVEVLSKFPSDLDERISSAKWKDRKEVLEEVSLVLEKAVKIKNDDYTHIFRVLAKCMKDANIQVVQLAGNCVEFLVKGLGQNFSYKSIVLLPMIERTKEKKQSVADALNNALDSMFVVSGLSAILDDTLTGMTNKTPQIKIASTNYLQRCLANTAAAPSSGEIDSIMSQGVKLLSESQEPIRQASTEMIGTLMKITGERELARFLEKIDDNRKSKVDSFYKTVEVKAKKTGAAPSAKSKIEPIRKLAPPTTSSLPAKRTATSPAKRVDTLKQSSYGRGGLTGRSLTNSRPQVPVAPVAPVQEQIDHIAELSKLKQEVEALRLEKMKWVAQKEMYEESRNNLKQENAKLSNELNLIAMNNEDINRDYTNATMLIKQKDTQINRLNNDLEGERLKNKDLEQQIEMMKLQQNKKSFTNTTSNNTSTNRQSLTFTPTNNTNHNVFNPPQSNSPEVSSRTSGDLSSRVNRLSIDANLGLQRDLNFANTNNTRYGSPKRLNFTSTTKPSSMELDTNDDSWKRAAEVTSKLKERIEKMKARSRGGQSEVNPLNM